MLRFLWIIGVTSAVMQTVVLLAAPTASAQQTSDYDSTCYFRIEGQATQDLARLCGKKKQQATTRPTSAPGQPLTRSDTIPASRDPDDDSTDGAEPTPARLPLPTRPSLPSLPSMRVPPTATPTVPPVPAVRPRTSSAAVSSIPLYL